MDSIPPGEFILRRIGARIGKNLQTAASMVPLPVAVRSGAIAAVKGGFTGSALFFPEPPPFVLLEGLPPPIGRAIDVLEADLRAGEILSVPGDIDKVIGTAIAGFGTPGLGGVVLATSFWGHDP
jgi:hypothetical protein